MVMMMSKNDDDGDEEAAGFIHTGSNPADTDKPKADTHARALSLLFAKSTKYSD